jgi:hypothetical protein
VRNRKTKPKTLNAKHTKQDIGQALNAKKSKKNYLFMNKSIVNVSSTVIIPIESSNSLQAWQTSADNCSYNI